MAQGQRTVLALDSGAYSVYREKKKGNVMTINIGGLIIFLLTRGEYLHLSFALDVIDQEDDLDGAVSYDNWAYMRRFIPDVIPTYHSGKDLNYLKRYLDKSEIVAVGGSADDPPKKREEQLDHIWQTYLLDRNGKPRAKIHGLGLTSAELVAKWPWYSVDSTSWAKDAGYRSVLIPQKSQTGSGYDYTKTPIRVSVTLRPFNIPRNHITRLPKNKADHVIEYLAKMGFHVGRGYRSDPRYEPGLCNDPTMRYQINAIYNSKLGEATGTKVFLAGNYESSSKPEMERKIRQSVWKAGCDYYRLMSFADKPDDIMNIINLKKKEECHDANSRSLTTQTA
jgi:hypothetical protein